MKMTQLLYFKTVAEDGRISVAARKLFVTAPAVSIAITNLEKELGVQLFDRVKNRLLLNDYGRAYLQYVNQVFDDLNLAKQVISDMQADHIDAGNFCLSGDDNEVNTESMIQ